jgi:hypothetical protein
VSGILLRGEGFGINGKRREETGAI